MSQNRQTAERQNARVSFTSPDRSGKWSDMHVVVRAEDYDALYDSLLLAEARPTLLSRSLINCHAVGLDSIVLKGAPNMVRIFLARPEHTLGQNDPWATSDMTPFSLGMRAHHCDVTLVPLFGEVNNVVECRGPADCFPHVWMDAYEYQSQIEETGAFRPRFGRSEFELGFIELREPTHMKARTRHSICVKAGESAAWMVVEGAEDPNYAPITWSNAALTKFNFAPLYKPMTPERLAEDLALLAANGVTL